jgi:hypothetical protein
MLIKCNALPSNQRGHVNVLDVGRIVRRKHFGMIVSFYTQDASDKVYQIGEAYLPLTVILRSGRRPRLEG